MHPKIKKFFESNNRKITSKYLGDTKFWYATNVNNKYDSLIVYSENSRFDVKLYCFNEKFYSEEEMLKIIKMKTFI
jgi:hypothetical protein